MLGSADDVIVWGEIEGVPGAAQMFTSHQGEGGDHGKRSIEGPLPRRRLAKAYLGTVSDAHRIKRQF